MKCPSCGIEVSSSYLKCPSCGAGFHGVSSASSFNKPQYFPSKPIPASSNANWIAPQNISGSQSSQYASFGIRLVASIIDNLIVIVPAFIIGGLIGFWGVLTGDPESMYVLKAQFVGFILNILYEALFLSSSWQATPGKRLMGLKVVDVNFQPLSFWKAAGRSLGKIVSTVILYIGFIMAAFTKNKQALHDIMSGTYVVRK
jgi:uncharacterized RDD family membrane protein YckC